MCLILGGTRRSAAASTWHSGPLKRRQSHPLHSTSHHQLPIYYSPVRYIFEETSTFQTRMTGAEDVPVTDRLFGPERQQRPELWQFIKLVAPTAEKKKCKSREAVGAYCTKCNKDITYSKGTSKQILRHMEQYHSEDLHRKSSTNKRCLEQQSIIKAIKHLKPVNEALSQKGCFLLLKWIAESYRPLSIVEDPGLLRYSLFLNELEKKFTLPSRHTMTRLLHSTFADTQLAIKGMIQEECDYYSLTSDIWTSRTSEAYISLMIVNHQ